MAGKLPPVKLKPGDELTVAWLNAVRNIAVEGSIADLGAGLKGNPTPNGWAIGVAHNAAAGSVCKTTSTITARSGTTVGSGTVDFYQRVGTTLTATGLSTTVYSYSSTTGGVASGQYGWAQQDEVGDWWLISVDCGN